MLLDGGQRDGGICVPEPLISADERPAFALLTTACSYIASVADATALWSANELAIDVCFELEQPLHARGVNGFNVRTSYVDTSN